jgi:Clp protease
LLLKIHADVALTKGRSQHWRIEMNWMLLPLCISVLVAMPNQITRAESAKVTGSVHCNGSITMDIEGDIDAATVESIKKIFDESHEKALKARTTKCPEIKNDFAAFGDHYGINSRGGSVSAAMTIGRMFRKENKHLFVDRNCISACVLILAGAVDREIGKSAIIGIHRPYLGTTPQHPLTTDQVRSGYTAMLQDMRIYLREMNVSERLANDMLATEPERVHVLTGAELKSYGLAGLDPAEQQRRAIGNEARDVYEANQLGLDRQEYTRRKSLGISLCFYSLTTGELMTDGEVLECRRRILTTGR